MAGYGRDYGRAGRWGGSWADPYRGGWSRSAYGADYDFGAQAGLGGRAHGGTPYGGGQGYPEGGGWSGVEYGVYLEQDRPGGGWGREPGYGADYGRAPATRGGGGRVEWAQDGAPNRWGSASRTRASEIMTEDPEVVTPDTSLAEVAQRMRDLDVGIIPVVAGTEQMQLKGVITDRDIAVRAAADGKDMKKSTAGDFMTSDVESVHEGSDVREVFAVMKRSRVRRVPVVDDEGRLVGIIAQADLAVDYAGLDVDREAEVEEVVERISEPARPSYRRGGWERQGRRYVRSGPYRPGYDRDMSDFDLGDRLRQGWRTLRRGARDLAYDRGWR